MVDRHKQSNGRASQKAREELDRNLECESKNDTKATDNFFTWKSKSGKRRRIHCIFRLQELQRLHARVLVLGLFFRKEHAPLAGGKCSFILNLIRMHEGRRYKRDLRNCI